MCSSDLFPSHDKTPEEIETMMEEVGLKQGLKGNFQFWKDIRDRIHGQSKQHVEVVADINLTLTEEEKNKLLGLLHEESTTESN